MLESFVIYCQIARMLAGMDATGLSHGQASYYYTKRFKLQRKFVKMTICADLRRQLVCGIKIRHKRRDDRVDFIPLLQRLTNLALVDTVVANRGYDSERNHVAAQNLGIPNTIIPAKICIRAPVQDPRGFHRKVMKRYFRWKTHHQRRKAETIFSVIKRMLGEHIMSRNIVIKQRSAVQGDCLQLLQDYQGLFGNLWMVSTQLLKFVFIC
ncbi:MAG: transposase [Thaumarchaeota archaeon]|nr:transposase [Nitrososphaerota archaeon]